MPAPLPPPPSALPPSGLTEPGFPPARRSGRSGKYWLIRFGISAAVLTALAAAGAFATHVDGTLGTEVGDCVKDVPDEATSSLKTVPCAKPHEGEVFALLDEADDAPFPGALEGMRASFQRCIDAFPSYTGTTLTQSGLDVAMKWPSYDSWEHDDRTTVCIIREGSATATGSRRGSAPVEALPRERSVLTMTEGDCFTSPQLLQGKGVTAVELEPCEQPHDGEVFAVYDVPATLEYDELDKEVEQTCYDRFEEVVGVPYQRSKLLAGWILPQKKSWDDVGDRRVVCLAVDDSHSLVGTVRGMRR